jgi:hypothetical protein
MKKVLFLMILPFLILGTAGVKAQVVIGSEEGPHEGAVLDLSQTTKLGLLLPSVFLENVSEWQLNGTSEDGEGMLIYNTNEATDGGNGKGIYVWKEKWVSVNITACTNFPWVTSPSGAQAREVNKNGVLTIEVTGDGNGDTPSYQWQHSPDGTNGWTDVSTSGVSSGYSVPTTTEGTYYFRCRVSNNCSSTFSPVFTVQVTNCTQAPAITSPAVDQTPTVFKDGTLDLTIVADGIDGTPSYQWKTSTDGVDNWNNVASDGTAATYRVPSGTAGTYYYRCAVSNGCYTTTSVKFTVTVHSCTAAPSIAASGQYAFEVNKNATQDISVSADGHGATMSYQWQYSADGEDSWSAVASGGNSATYAVPTGTSGTTYYRCLVTSACGLATSGTYSVNVMAPACSGYLVTNSAYSGSETVSLGSGTTIWTVFQALNTFTAVGDLCVAATDAGTAVPAAEVAAQCSSPWRLPSAAEMMQPGFLQSVGSFTVDNYWTASFAVSGERVRFHTNRYLGLGAGNWGVRCVRGL